MLSCQWESAESYPLHQKQRRHSKIAARNRGSARLSFYFFSELLLLESHSRFSQLLSVTFPITFCHLYPFPHYAPFPRILKYHVDVKGKRFRESSTYTNVHSSKAPCIIESLYIRLHKMKGQNNYTFIDQIIRLYNQCSYLNVKESLTFPRLSQLFLESYPISQS